MRRLVDALAGSIWTTLAAVGAIGAAAVGAGHALDLTLTGAIGLYFVVWWTLLFAILPVRISTQSDEGEIAAGTDPGAPARPALRERAIWTSIVSALVFIAVAAVFPLAGL